MKKETEQHLARAKEILEEIGGPRRSIEPGRCQGCGHEFAPDEIAYVARTTREDPWSRHGYGWGHESYCADCVKGWHPSWWQVAQQKQPRPCVTCGQPMVSFGLWSAAKTCSRQCSWHRPRTHVEHEPRACEHCGEEFTPKRSDARFCSVRCRVAAHRGKADEREAE